MRIVSRKEWGARHGQGDPLRGPLGTVFIHTEAVKRGHQTEADERAAMQTTEQFHVRSRGWAGIAYSFCVFPSGRAYEGRGWLRRGAHTEGYNSLAHAICFMGHGDVQPATAQQWEAARWLIEEGIRLGVVTSSPAIRGHREVARKTCPGNLIYPRLEVLRGITVPPPGAAPIEEDDVKAVQFTPEIDAFGWYGPVGGRVPEGLRGHVHVGIPGQSSTHVPSMAMANDGEWQGPLHVTRAPKGTDWLKTMPPVNGPWRAELLRLTAEGKIDGWIPTVTAAT